MDTLNTTLDTWINELENYDFTKLCTQPSEGHWSLGQVYMHLIENTAFYLEQIKICISTDENAREAASSDARKMFEANDFPDIPIEGPPENNLTPQPLSKEQMKSRLTDLKFQLNKVAPLIANGTSNGKTRHPGLQYFNAKEWLQFTEMHFRHHLRQKKRIDDFLNRND